MKLGGKSCGGGGGGSDGGKLEGGFDQNTLSVLWNPQWKLGNPKKQWLFFTCFAELEEPGVCLFMSVSLSCPETHYVTP